MSGGPLIALTGATGFVGRFLVDDLARRGYRVRLLLRRPVDGVGAAEQAAIGDLSRPMNLNDALRGVDFVVHSAGIAHAMSGRPEDDYRAINRDATVTLARAARQAGVRRFVFLSSVRAQSGPMAPGVLRENDAAEPTDAYGRSKLEAERALAEIDLPFTALRPVLVYGPGVKGNLAALVALARKPLPLPFGAFRAPRSLVGLDSLASAVDVALRAADAPSGPLLVADDEPLGLGAMIAAYRAGLGRRPGLLPVPPALLTGALRLLGKGEMAERLNGGLAVDTGALKALGWRPAGTAAEGLRRLGAHDKDHSA